MEVGAGESDCGSKVTGTPASSVVAEGLLIAPISTRVWPFSTTCEPSAGEVIGPLTRAAAVIEAMNAVAEKESLASPNPGAAGDSAGKFDAALALIAKTAAAAAETPA